MIEHVLSAHHMISHPLTNNLITSPGKCPDKTFIAGLIPVGDQELPVLSGFCEGILSMPETYRNQDRVVDTCSGMCILASLCSGSRQPNSQQKLKLDAALT